MVFLTLNDNGDLIEVEDINLEVTEEEWEIARLPIFPEDED